MGHGLLAPPDPVIVGIQVVLFFISFLTLHFLVFKPYVQLLKLRQARTIGLRDKAAHAREKSAKLQADYDGHMKEERRKVAAWTDGERRKIADAERDIIQAARDQAGKDLQSARKKTDDELKEAQRALSPLAVEFSSAIASRLLGYKVKVPPKNVEGSKSAETETVLN